MERDTREISDWGRNDLRCCKGNDVIMSARNDFPFSIQEDGLSTMWWERNLIIFLTEGGYRKVKR
jgi:hypothetical protein